MKPARKTGVVRLFLTGVVVVALLGLGHWAGGPPAGNVLTQIDRAYQEGLSVGRNEAMGSQVGDLGLGIFVTEDPVKSQVEPGGYNGITIAVPRESYMTYAVETNSAVPLDFLMLSSGQYNAFEGGRAFDETDCTHYHAVRAVNQCRIAAGTYYLVVDYSNRGVAKAPVNGTIVDATIAYRLD